MLIVQLIRLHREIGARLGLMMVVLLLLFGYMSPPTLAAVVVLVDVLVGLYQIGCEFVQWPRVGIPLWSWDQGGCWFRHSRW